MLLGIDTGGTFTDAVLVEDPPDGSRARVIAAAKSPTTHHDLAIGVCSAIDAVLALDRRGAAAVELVSLSTTLATNALVEGRGRRVVAVIIGFDADVVERAGLAEALDGDPVIVLPGGHDVHGGEAAPLDLDRLAEELRSVAPRVEAVAVMAQFSVRNPAHEVAAAEVVRRVSALPVTLSHHLSARLNGPRRAVTAVLNARLVPVIGELVRTTESALFDRGITAPLMVVRGDGSLVSAEYVRERPIETILSGPAASLVGAAHLTGLTDAVISDIGGTTTDIAVLRDGLPEVSADGATVGGHRTMVSAVAMRTHGLGGDSIVRHDDRADGLVLRLGPERIVPLSRIAWEAPEVVHRMLRDQAAAASTSDLDGVVLVVERRDEWMTRLEGAERLVVERMGGRVAAADRVLDSAVLRRAAERLVRRGVVQRAGFTPTDAVVALGLHDGGDASAAVAAAALFARRRDRRGRAIAAEAAAMAEAVVAAVVRRSAGLVLAAVFEHDGLDPAAVGSPIVQAGLDGHRGVAAVRIGLEGPLVGLGASAVAYYPRVATTLGARCVVPAHAEVANAVGAVVGRVRIAVECVVSAPDQGRFVVHAGPRPSVHLDLAAARAAARVTLEERLASDMAAAGAPTFELREDWNEDVVDLDGHPMFVEGRLRLIASGRPMVTPGG